MRSHITANRFNPVISRLFVRLLPVQVLIFTVSSINFIVDGAIAGRCIDAVSVGVVGLYYSMLNLIDSANTVLLGGSAVLCGHSMGRGDIEETSRIFSLNMMLSFIVSGIITAVSVIVPESVADWLGASPELNRSLQLYILGYAVGVIPKLLAQQLASFLQMERQSSRGMVGLIGMIISNIVLDIVLVAVLRMGIFGLALATSISNWVYFLILVPYYLSGKSALKFRIRSIDWSKAWPLIKIGFPGALLVFCLTIRTVIINRTLLHYSGTDGLSALSAYNMLSGFFIAFALGTAAVVRMLGSIALGEEDRDSLRDVIGITFTRMMPFSLVFTAAMLVLSVPLSVLFFPDRGSEVFRLSVQLLRIFAFCIPMIVAVVSTSGYLQSAGHHLFVNIFSVFDGLISMTAIALILAPIMGATGVWLANPIGIMMTMLLVPIYELVFWKRVPQNIDEWLFLRPEFGVPEADSLAISLHSMEDVIGASERVNEFCLEHSIDPKTSYYAALACEEMAGNIVEHGYTKDDRDHNIYLKVVYKNGNVLLRIKDDCVPFDPRERAEIYSEEDPLRNIGIRMISKLADELTYNNMLGLNVLTIRFACPEHED